MTTASMHFVLLLSLCIYCAAGVAQALAKQHVLAVPDGARAQGIPTQRESTILARRLLKLTSLGTLSTVFPVKSSSNSVVDTAPIDSDSHGIDISGNPIGLVDYFASCEPVHFNPTILAIGMATPIRNARAGSNITLSIRWHPPSSAPPSGDPYLYSPMNMPRLSMIGHLEPLSPDVVNKGNVEACFEKAHPDAFWTPGGDVHDSFWATIVVEAIYWIGGFGDRSFIGWLPIDLWRTVSDEEVAGARLVGEQGYHLPSAFGHVKPELVYS